MLLYDSLGFCTAVPDQAAYEIIADKTAEKVFKAAGIVSSPLIDSETQTPAKM